MRSAARALIALTLATQCAAEGVYQTPEAFVAEAFGGTAPDASRLWIEEGLKGEIRAILEHDLGVLRLRYWGRAGRTAWVLEEIGKERPITAGFVVDRGKIERIKVLIFRESRGGEVRYPFFTDQFSGAGLTEGLALDRPIDGVTGATLSVRALTKLARLALLLHNHSEFTDGAPEQ